MIKSTTGEIFAFTRIRHFNKKEKRAEYHLKPKMYFVVDIGDSTQSGYNRENPDQTKRGFTQEGDGKQGKIGKLRILRKALNFF